MTGPLHDAEMLLSARAMIGHRKLKLKNLVDNF